MFLSTPHGPNVLLGMPQVARTHPDGSEVTGRMPRTFRGPDGRLSVGGLGVLADDVLGWSLVAGLPAGAWTVSTEIWVDVVAPLPAAGGPVGALARTRQTGSYSEGAITDGEGAVLAEIRERGRRVPQDVGALTMEAPEGEVPAGTDDVAELLGLVPTGSGVLQMKMGPLHDNPRGMLHGGLSLAGSEIAATRSRAEAGSPLVTSSVHIVHARGIPSGSVVDFRVTTAHAGRGLWVSDVTGLVDGRAATLARVVAEPAF